MHTLAVNAPSAFHVHHQTTAQRGKDGTLHIAVKGNKGSGWSLGDALPTTAYTIKIKTFVYRIESALLEPGRPVGVTDNDAVGGSATDEDRYSVVSADNFNYYEVKIILIRTSLVSLLTHYGSVKVFTS